MRPRDLKHILFVGPGEGGRALFHSQRELARRIAQRPKSRYHEKEVSLVAFLNQVLLGRRPCPADLQQELRVVIREALSKEKRPESEQLEVEQALALLVPQHGQVDQLLLRQRGAEEVVVVNPYPLEERRHPRADEFQDAMLSKLLAGTGKYTFVLDEKEPGPRKRFREATLAGIASRSAKKSTQRGAQADAEGKLAELETSSRLALRLAPPSVCIIPLVAFDPHDRENCDVYVWDWEFEEGRTQPREYVAPLSRTVVNKWLRDFYDGLLLGAKPLRTERMADDPATDR